MSDQIVFKEAIHQDAPAVGKLFKEFLDFHKDRDSYYDRADSAHKLVEDFFNKSYLK